MYEFELKCFNYPFKVKVMDKADCLKLDLYFAGVKVHSKVVVRNFDINIENIRFQLESELLFAKNLLDVILFLFYLLPNPLRHSL